MNEKDTIKIRNIYNKYRWKAVFLYGLFTLCLLFGFGHSIFRTFKLMSPEEIIFVMMFVALPVIFISTILSNTWKMIRIIKDGKTETEQKVPEEES